MLLAGAGKCAFFVAKQLTFNQLLRQRRAINSDEGGVYPWALLVDRACGEFFATATFAYQQHVGVGTRHPSNQAVELSHGVGRAQQQPILIQVRGMRSQVGRFAVAQAVFTGQLLQHFLDVAVIQRRTEMERHALRHHFIEPLARAAVRDHHPVGMGTLVFAEEGVILLTHLMGDQHVKIGLGRVVGIGQGKFQAIQLLREQCGGLAQCGRQRIAGVKGVVTRGQQDRCAWHAVYSLWWRIRGKPLGSTGRICRCFGE